MPEKRWTAVITVEGFVSEQTAAAFAKAISDKLDGARQAGLTVNTATTDVPVTA